jgi:hypothetical protein
MKIHPGDRVSSFLVKEVMHDYALCECSCGSLMKIRTYDVIFGKVRSCGCLSTLKEDTAITIQRYYNRYQRSALEKKYSFNISLPDFKKLIKLNCHYCGMPPIDTVNLYGRYLVCNGIDRKNPDVGYESHNIITCCRYCNYSKGSLQYEEFLKHVDKIYQYFLGEGGVSFPGIFIDPRYYHTIFSIVSSRGTKKNITYQLGISDTIKMVTSSCFYCGGGFSTVITVNPLKNIHLHINGIDRIDSDKGYTLENSVPCCKVCNFLKRDYEFLFFLKQVKAIYNRRFYAQV